MLDDREQPEARSHPAGESPQMQELSRSAEPAAEADQAGDVIARIDDGDYRLAVQTAHDQIAVQQASIQRFAKQITAQEAAVDQAKAQLASAKAGAVRSDLELKRQQDLATRQINSRAALEQAQANYDQAAASVQAAEASIESAAANVEVLKAQREEAARTLRQFETSLAKVERDLSFTVIVQRLPVRILVPAEVAEQGVLRPGMSVVVKVNTKPDAPSPSQAMSTAALRTSVR